MKPERWKQIERLFDAALERPPERRAAFLEQACADDPELLREVQTLLAHEGGAGDSLAALISDAAHFLAADREDLVGRRIGAYRVTGLIGEGGMGTVWRAVRDDDQFRKEVAIKLVKSGLHSGLTLSRFRHERQILANLEHPNIARLLDGGATEEGLPYLVMEYVDGEPVVEYCRKRRLSIRERLGLFRQVCAAVSHAHRNLVVHRDLKPSNILVTDDGTPKLLDFGVAKLLDSETSPETTKLTMTAMRMMTPHYASPEQVRGEAVTTSTDVYSAGVVLYELLTGRPPYEVTSLSALEMERLICQTEPIKPSAVAESDSVPSAKLRRQLAGDLDNIVLMAMRKEPERRYQSAEQMSEDLRRYLNGEPVAAAGDAFRYRLGKFVRRHRVGVGFAAILALLLLGFAAAMARQAVRIAKERDRANLEAATARQVTDFLVGLFKVSDPSEAKGNTVTAREILDKGAQEAAEQLKDQPKVQARLMDTMGLVYSNLGLYDEAGTLLQQALKVRREALGEIDLDMADSVANLATVALRRGDYAAAEPLYREALSLYRELLGDEHPEVALSMNNLAELLREKGDYEGAESLYKQALELFRKSDNDPRAVITMNNLGVLLTDRGDYEAAEPLLREALEIKRITLGEQDLSLANNLTNLASLMHAKRDYEEAERLYREALDLRRTHLDADHPDIGISLNNLALLLQDKGDYEAAEPLSRESLEIRRKKFGPESPHVATALNNLARLMEREGKYEAAEPLFRNAVATYRKSLNPNNWLIHNALNNYGACLTKLGRFPEAETNLQEAHAGLKAALGVEHERTQKALQNLVDLYQAWGKPDKAARHRSLIRPQ